MHIHGMQNYAADALNALYGAQQAQARQRAAETRRKLFASASLLECDTEDFIVTLGDRQESGPGQRERKTRQNENLPPDAEAETAQPDVSDWA